MNNTISLGGYKGIGAAEWAIKLTKMQANSIIAPVVPSNDENLQLLILGLSCTNTAAFTYYRYKVYNYIHKRFKGKELTPVDFMTLTVCLIQHSELLWDLIMGVLMMSVTNGYLDVNTVMPLFCPFVTHVTTFMWAHSVSGGLCIAIYRIMLIKHQHLVNYVIGKKCLLYIILFCGILFLGFFVVITTFLHSLWNPLRPPCFHLTGISVLESIDAYNQTFGNPPLSYSFVMTQISLVLLFLMLTFTEIIIYCNIFLHLYKHDNKENLKKLLGLEQINQRNMRNVMTLASSFFSFLAEMSFGILIIICLISSSNYLVPIFLRNFTLTIMAIIEVKTSQNLK